MVDVSVIVPFYNSKETVIKTLASLKKQELKAMEIIVVDDGSSEQVGDLYERYGSDPSIRILRQEHRGVSAARNLGLSQARGQYIGFVDSDDWVEHDMYSSMYSEAIEQQADICLGSFVIEHDGSRLPRILRLEPDKLDSHEKLASYLISNMISGKDPLSWDDTIMGSVCRMLFRRDFIIENKLFFDENLSVMEDLAFCIEAISRSRSIVVSKTCGYHYVYSRGSSINRYRDGLYSQIRLLDSKLLGLLKQGQYLSPGLEVKLGERYLRGCIWAITNEANVKNKQAMGKKLGLISSICQDIRARGLIRNLNLYKYSKKTQLKLFAIDKNLSLVLYTYFKLVSCFKH